MHRQAPLLVLAIAAGALTGVLGVSIWPGDPAGAPTRSSIKPVRADPTRTPDLDHLADVVESLAQTLDDEINERRVLGEQLERLRSELEDLTQNLGPRVEQAFNARNAARQESGEAIEQGSVEDRLAAAGITPQQQAFIRGLQADSQMAAIELDDRARREGWLNTPRYFKEAQELSSGSAAIRGVLGDEVYDRYLFASGLPNRLTVGMIIESSPAQKAGFQRGDVILRYAGERVFSNEQLVGLRSSGVRGEPVTVEILRDGRRMQLTMPRGPMGLSGAPTTVDPDAPQD